MDTGSIVGSQLLPIITQSVRHLHALRTRGNNGAFIKLNKATFTMLRIVDPQGGSRARNLLRWT
ncbi:hypothetical protein PRIPAC_84610 [Pristionchus pacificus]|uniref:Uncharacterized protein n=1 Tax=Pristionchus pacificus TaxID=54126 RepID=A0A2A6CE61_PRIPA|nr:hypothetical protein PRIPAC_84610 [Pristionchus pacificus]|eukprot:PDM76535.1 hypothetical protein PRIPAC_42901 [Pristionchus pacificus]